MDDVVKTAVEFGILNPSDTDRVRPDHLPILTAIMGFMEIHELHSEEVHDFEVNQYEEELELLSDMVDLEDCDRVEPGKTFSNDEIAMGVPRYLIPFMRQVILPAIRRELLS